MNSTFKVDSEVITKMMTSEFSFSHRSSALHFTRTYFQFKKKMKINIIFIIFNLVPALVSGELKDLNPNGKVSV